MKESIGGAWLFQIVIVFIVLFAAILAVAINYGRAYKVKAEIINIIEREQGMNDAAETRITKYLSQAQYHTTGTCTRGLENYDEVPYGNNNMMSTKALYCIRTVKTRKGKDELVDQAYYEVIVFFNFDVPIMDQFNLKLKGVTKVINRPQE